MVILWWIVRGTSQRAARRALVMACVYVVLASILAMSQDG